MANENQTFTDITDTKPYVDKVSEADDAVLKSITGSIVQMIKVKHLI